MFALFAMFLFPESKKIRAICQESPYTVDVILGDGLQDDTAEMVFRNMDLRTSFNLVFTTEFRRNYKLSLRRKCRTEILHVLTLYQSKATLQMLDSKTGGRTYDPTASAGIFPPPSKCASISSRVFPFVSGRNATAVMK